MKTRGLKLGNEWPEECGGTKEKTISQSGRRFLVINLQLRILKHVEQLLLLRKEE
jgi:hypothetical protein